MDKKNHKGTIIFSIEMRWVEHTHSFQMYHASTGHLLYDFVEQSWLQKVKRKLLIFIIKLLGDRGFFDCISLNRIFPGISKNEVKQYTIMVKEKTK